ncbi:Piwi-domain-containing protein [Gloeophyllum trabeum ATCC 11539]|uniref:Piwi-domain-containing protein n=1 Tax=Gloeophyllum trabeum (strain ATCC 11539 / FP-39264 / Madison 617) TaxID=670483 RepID=S7QLI1_GLOTA|nr:Piwi-domain-containing protein [Gloeophyllum trabeum ATCC 11539]EPQ60238.1 Piwi-domain-containing protein [Gloeophyllum trabeum ATCC 11539]
MLYTRPDPQHPIRRPTSVNIRVTFAKQVQKTYLEIIYNGRGAADLLSGRPFEHEEATTALNALNVIFQQAPSTAGSVRDGRRLFPRAAQHSRPIGPFHMVQGYFQSVRPIPRALMVNVDVVTGLQIRVSDLTTFAAEYLEVTLQRLRDISGQDLQKLRYALKGLRIETTNGSRPKRYVISDLVRQAGRYQFDKGATKLTVAEHYLQAYQIRLRYPDMVGVKIRHRGDHDTILPFEVCKLVIPQVYKKQPPPRMQAEIVRYAVKDPLDRMQAIRDARNALAYDASVALAGAGLSVAGDLQRLRGRLLFAPDLEFGNQAKLTFRPQETGVWNVTKYQFAVPMAIKTWVIINLSSLQDAVVHALGQELRNAMNARGMYVQQPPLLDRMASPDSETMKRAFLSRPKPDLAIFILPRNSPDLYRLVKRLGDIDLGLVTQCVTEGKSYNNQYCNNLALKINVKLGGVNSFVRSPIMNNLKDIRVMALGADVSHPTDLSQPSVASLVSSWDDHCSKYVASISIQRPRQEVIENMQSMVERALRCYQENHGKQLPRLLLFYRDGVSEGEYRTLALTEVNAIKAACHKVCEEARTRDIPHLAFVIVGKRHHIRFFPGNEGAADRTRNCRSGLVVDKEISHPTEFNYYLQSQPGLKGTSRPSHYVVIINSKRLSPDILQQLSYGLCFAYARATRAVSIPAPVYYADLVCRRARFHFDDRVSLHADYGSDTSGPFDLHFWQQHFTPANGNMANTMYFV